MARCGVLLSAWWILASAIVQASPPEIIEVVVDPAEVRLVGPDATWTLLVHGRTAAGGWVDLTRESTFSAKGTAISVTSTGLVKALQDSAGTVDVEVAGRRAQAEIMVAGTQSSRNYHFENDIVPLLNKFACNSSGCHGKAEGQNGFKLSVFGSDPPADYDALTKEARGRRVFPAAADQSLLLKKASGGLPHGGGIRISPDSREYATLRDWIASGAPVGDPEAPQVVAISVTPEERVMGLKAQQQLRVVARYSDGRFEDVTALAKFQSNNETLASVDGEGLVGTSDVPGLAAVMASYQAQVAVFRVMIPRPEPLPSLAPAAEFNFVDPLVNDQLRKLNIAPSELAEDAEFLRRVYLDTIGVLPTAAEARSFLGDQRSDRRARLIDQLLERPEFDDLWSLWWADVLRVDRQTLGHKGAKAFHDWIRNSLSAKKPLDQFARECIAAEGPLAEAPAGHFYQVVKQPGAAASTISQVFLGVRIACAECHHHPFDQWSQTDYYGMQAFFSQVQFKKTPHGLALVAQGDPETRHPRTKELVTAHALLQPMPEKNIAGDRRLALAQWLTTADNPWFARNLANRIWAHFLGRGIVEPVDDFRATNPPTNPALLDALARSLAEQQFDFRALVRTITNSATYQRSSRPHATNERDEQNYSRAIFRRIPAEVLLDAVCDVTGVPEKFEGHAGGIRAVQMWDSHVQHYFLRLFGRPLRQTACECERSGEASVSQVLHLMNSPEISAKLAHEGGRVAALVRAQDDDRQLVEELYLTFYNRFPTPSEHDAGVAYLKSRPDDRRRGAEDLAWSMLNSLEFVFNH